jgi:hypothetical protein
MREKQTIVATDKRIAPTPNDTALCNLFASLERDVHVSIDGLQVT